MQALATVLPGTRVPLLSVPDNQSHDFLSENMALVMLCQDSGP
jgi:hypothetical protein